ncbi:MAG TPA: pyruvate kinase [Burkholderiales bacterium]
MTAAHRQRTRIVCTLGPATDEPGILPQLVAEGMDVARINMSHGDHADHARRIGQVRDAARQAGLSVAILMDLPGPKFRVGQFEGGSLALREGTQICLSGEEGRTDCLPVRHRELLDALHPEESIYLADGSIELCVKAKSADRVDCDVIIGGTVRPGSGINVPDSALGGLIPTRDDVAHLAFAVSHGADWVGVSFVQTADDLARVREHLPGTGAPLLMAKIEKRRALVELDAIIGAADGVMVARGDLGVETDLAHIPLVQKRIIAAANARARPVVTATQMLESMVERPHPTRAEVTDVANAVLDGTDAVMLSAESAVGRHPVAAVRVLRRVIAATEAEYGPRMALDRLRASAQVSVDEAVIVAASRFVARSDARAIIAEVRDVEGAAAIARFRPAAPLVAATRSEAAYRSLTMVWGAFPLRIESSADQAEIVARSARWLYAHGLAQPGDRAVILSCSAQARDADILRLVRLPA